MRRYVQTLMLHVRLTWFVINGCFTWHDMHRPLTRVVIAITLSCISTLAQADLLSKGDQVPPKLMSSEKPEYPSGALRGNIEGWVRLRFTVLSNGEVGDVEVERASPSGIFDKAAVSALKKWRYSPGTVNGAPIDWHNLEVRIKFQIGDPWADEFFQRRYSQIAVLVKGSKFTEAKAAAESAIKTSGNGFEVIYYEYLLAHADLGLGDYSGALFAIQDVTTDDDDTAADIRENALRLRFEAELALRRYGDALRTYERIKSLKILSADDPLRKTAEQIKTAVDANAPISLDATISEGSWSYWPLRHILTVINLKGSIKDIRFLCDLKSTTLQFQSDVEWNIPPSWGSCMVVFSGTDGTTFTVVEYKEAAAPEPAASQPAPQ